MVKIISMPDGVEFDDAVAEHLLVTRPEELVRVIQSS